MKSRAMPVGQSTWVVSCPQGLTMNLECVCLCLDQIVSRVIATGKTLESVLLLVDVGAVETWAAAFQRLHAAEYADLLSPD